MSDQKPSQSLKVEEGVTLGLNSDSNKVKKAEFAALERKLQGEKEEISKQLESAKQKAEKAEEDAREANEAAKLAGKAAEKARREADDAKQMMGTIFTGIGIQQGSQAVAAYSTREGATIKVENQEYDDRILNLEQVNESNQEKVSEIEGLKEKINQLERNAKSQKKPCVIS